MARKKKILLLLLTLCIALASVPGYAAGVGDLANPMSMDCVDCDMHRGVDDDACDGSTCMMSAGYCGVLFPLSLPTSAMVAPRSGAALHGWRSAAVSDYRSRLDFSIFRPPIA